jgi:predicted TIM-barrel fold metal-dependent hydrolase
MTRPPLTLVSEQERPLPLDVEICDPHHHLWVRPGSAYLLPQFQADVASTAVRSSVFVECRSHYRDEGPEHLRSVGETEWVTTVADQAGLEPGRGLLGAIVASADIRRGAAIREVIAAHREASRGRLRGIRHSTNYDPSPLIHNAASNPPPDLLRQPIAWNALRVVADEQLCFDTWVYHPQLDQIAELAEQLPDLTIVVDHLGGPLGIGPYEHPGRVVPPGWSDALRSLAWYPNIILKIGGLGTPLHGSPWGPINGRIIVPTSQQIADRWGESIRWCIEQFGPQRVMFESNAPMDRQSSGYTTTWNAFIRMTEGLSITDRRAVFADTARRTYRLR